MKKDAAIGIIGMGVMGRSLALNCAGKGIEVAVYNRHVKGLEENIASQFASGQRDLSNLSGFDTLPEFINVLKSPKIILLMIKAGGPVDGVINELLPYLNNGDVLIDGGNSHFRHSADRFEMLKKKNIFYIGMGISGGEEGALKGPSLMPGGSERGYILAHSILSQMAAKDKNNKPCTSYVGPGGAGHFVKMVHNGIEYAEMQLLAEVYQILKVRFNLDNPEIRDFFLECKNEGLNSFLLEVTIDILDYREDGEFLLDKVLDKSQQKGTGRWTVESALELDHPSSTISEAVMARLISSQKEFREQLSSHYPKEVNVKQYDEKERGRLKKAYQSARIINHLSGFDLLRNASMENKWNYNLSEIARIWTNGCIIRSELMEELYEIYADTEVGWNHLLIKEKLKINISMLSEVCADTLQSGLASPVLCASLNIFNGYTTKNSAANLIQAQRDYFGAHTFQRMDKAGYFHSNWK